MNETIILVGGGGHCKSVIDVIEQEGKYQIIGIVDKYCKPGSSVLGYPVVGNDDDLPKLAKVHKNDFITIGQIKTAAVRLKIFELTKDAGFNFPNIISPHSYVSKSALIGRGTIVMHDALINANTTVGENCIINSKTLIEHDSFIADFCHISTGTILNGGVRVDFGSFIGSGSIITENSKIKKNSFIKAGSIIK